MAGPSFLITWIVGDVIEESGPPMYRSGCFPLDWPDAAARLLEDVGAADVVVPGHRRPVTRDFVVDQLSVLTALAAQTRASWSAGLTIDDAIADDETWPLPTAGLRLAVERPTRRWVCSSIDPSDNQARDGPPTLIRRRRYPVRRPGSAPETVPSVRRAN